jgi:deoxyadenosine/deoxycytidine kinase
MTFRIEIAGGIAAGKSTLCKSLEQRGFAIIRENIAENFCLRREYANKASRGYDVQMLFFVSKASAIETHKSAAPIVVCDYALVTEYAYTNVHLKAVSPEGAAICRDAIDLRRKQIGAPDVLIYLDCPVDEQMRRIQTRHLKEGGREFELTHSREYLQGLNDEIRQAVETANDKNELGHVIDVDVSQVDVTDRAFVDKTVDTIMNVFRVKPLGNAPAP